MPTVTFRLSEGELQQLKRDASVRGLSVSELVREALAFRSANVEERLDDFERRLSRIESAAGFE